jgi:predicted glycosyltransferase
MFHGARILVAPLDWGLGHAARCVPVIRALQELDAVPVIGADKAPLALLRDAFPRVDHVVLPGLDVRYGNGNSQAWALARQLPAMLRQAGREEHMLRRLLPHLGLIATISDQRFGIRAPGVPSVLITHQLHPFSPFGQSLARRINRGYISRFTHCWIPDHAQPPGLAGALSHGDGLPGNARYIGPLSRFTSAKAPSGGPSWRIVAVISGPEPQRSLLEQAVVNQLQAIEGKHLVVTGKPGTPITDQDNIRTCGHLPTDALHHALMNAQLVVGRTGYSTLMDLEAIGRGALLVPTPGQPEQEYLGRLHRERGLHIIQAQQRLDLRAALVAPPGHRPPSSGSDALLAAMTDLARSIATIPAV